MKVKVKVLRMYDQYMQAYEAKHWLEDEYSIQTLILFDGSRHPWQLVIADYEYKRAHHLLKARARAK